MAETANAGQGADGETRRDFLYLATGAMGLVGAASVAWPMIDMLNPSADVLALATTEVDIGQLQEGQAITVTWRGKPVFIRHRTPAEIEEAEAVPMSDLIDPQPDDARVIEPQYLVMVGICTHLGCVPLGQSASDPKGDFGGWFCPCHGSHYDTSGRIRRGPAPTNLEVPEYAFRDDTTIVIG